MSDLFADPAASTGSEVTGETVLMSVVFNITQSK